MCERVGDTVNLTMEFNVAELCDKLFPDGT
jgi:hypothetical protein